MGMSALLERLSTHPEGESKMGSCGGDGAWPLDTPGGRFYAEWDTEAPTSREGQLIFFFQFLRLFPDWRWEKEIRRWRIAGEIIG
jgi:hypothetical protein